MKRLMIPGMVTHYAGWPTNKWSFYTAQIVAGWVDKIVERTEE